MKQEKKGERGGRVRLWSSKKGGVRGYPIPFLPPGGGGGGGGPPPGGGGGPVGGAYLRIKEILNNKRTKEWKIWNIERIEKQKGVCRRGKDMVSFFLGGSKIARRISLNSLSAKGSTTSFTSGPYV